MKDFRKELLKESMRRTEKTKQIFSKTASLSQKITVESIHEHNMRKESGMEKISMPVAQGQLKLKNSTSNLKWWVVNPSDRVQKIIDDIKAAFKPFLFALGKKGKKQPIDPKVYFPNGSFSPSSEQSKFSGEPQCSLRIEFGFSRQLIPTDKEFGPVAQNSVSKLNSILPGFSDFINLIDKLRITLNPFFHKISPSRAAGTLLGKRDIESFVESEYSRYKSNGIRLPDGNVLNTSKFYDQQMSLKESGIGLFPTLTDSFDRIYNTDEHLQSITDVMPLVRAVLEKMRQGYDLDKNALKLDIQESFNAIKGDSVSHQQSIEDTYNRISLAFDNSKKVLSPNEDPSGYEILWHNKATNKIYRGFKTIGNKSAKMPVGLDTKDIKLILKNLTIHGPGISRTFLYPDQFIIPGASMKYQSNGWDTHPTKPGNKMPLIPSLRNIGGKTQYDFDQINLGRIHLSMYGQQVKILLKNFGPKCKEWFSILQKTPKLDQNQNTEIIETIKNIIGDSGVLSRTNAETFAEALNQFPDYESMMSRLQYSSSSQNRGTSAIRSTDQSFIDKECFELLKSFGYYVSKMMDFTSGLMHRCCHESVKSRVEKMQLVSEDFYGRRYSTSGGKAAYGSVVVGVRYAFNSIELGSHDVNIQKIVREKRKNRQWARPKDGEPEVLRQTIHHQRGDIIDDVLQPEGEMSVVKLVENMQFWIGISSSDADFKKTVAVADDWASLLTKLHALYPNLDQEDGLALFDPLNVNIKKLQKAVSSTIAATLEEIESQEEMEPIEIVLKEYGGEMEVIDSQIKNRPEEFSTDMEEIQNSTSIPGPQYSNQTVLPKQPQTLQPPLENQEEKDVWNNNNQWETNTKPNDKPKPFPLPIPNYITKKKPSRNLFRKGVDPENSKLQRADVIDNLIKIADRLDRSGQFKISDKIEIFIRRLQQE